MGAASEFLRQSVMEQVWQNAARRAEPQFMLGQALTISDDAQTGTYTVSGVVVRHDGMVELQVVRKDAQDGRPSNSFR